MGYGFVDVFNAIGGLVSDVFYKADPKKSDVKNYFESIAKILQDTQAKLDALSKEQGVGDKGTQVVDTSKKASEWIKEMHKAVEDTAKAGDGGNESIANVAVGGAGNGKKADVGSVTGIAKGMKAIVDAAKKAGVEFKADDVDGDGGADNNAAGRLFASGNNAHAGDAAQAQRAAAKAGEAVSAVSGDQILKAIVDAAETTTGKGAGTATNAVEAAIGGDAEAAGRLFTSGNDGAGGEAGKLFANGGSESIANVAVGGGANAGKKADRGSVTGIAKGMKAIVDAAKKAGVEFKPADVDGANGGDAGKLFANGGNNLIANVADGGAGNGNGKKADKDSVTGIAKGMKAIVDAAKKAGVEFKAADVDGGAGADGDAGRLFANGNNGAGVAAQAAEGAAAKAGEAVSAVSGDQILKAIVDAAETTKGKGAAQAENAVEAAIGDDAGGAAAGVAFANAGMQKKNQIAAAIVLRGLAKDGKFANANDNANTKVKAAVKTSEWIKEMHKAVEDTAKAGDGGNDAGRLFASGGDARAGGAAAEGAAEKAGEAVSAVSGDQILKAIVDAAGTTEGKRANTAKNAVEAAIGADGAGNGAGANEGSVTGIAKGMKAIVDAAKKAGVEFKPDDVNGDANNKELRRRLGRLLVRLVGIRY
ncbi:variable large family protein [Borreliella burgdorferi]|uniref:variable large family protein n=2 Tax=Borreliella burgdorferi TaxID=139 RepID=UPI003AB47AA1